MPRRRPFVIVNMASSADGKIATANRAVNSLGSPADHEHLYELRATTDAILCGARTVNQPGVTLDSGAPEFIRRRERRQLSPQPIRVVVSGRATLSPDATVFSTPGAPVIVLTTEAAPARALKALRNRNTEIRCFGKSTVDLKAALAWLACEHGVRRLVCEGGAELNDAMFREGLIDELHLTLCPKVIGGREAPTISDGSGVPLLGQASSLELQRTRRVGDELFLVYRCAESRAQSP